MSPIELLRHFFENDDILRPMSTQTGFARFLGRSEPLIRSIERDRLQVSEKLARRISMITNVPEEWLLGKVDPTDPIPCRDGGLLTVEKLKHSIMAHGIMPRLDLDEPNTAVESVISRTMIDSLMTMIRAELIDYSMQRKPRGPDPLLELLKWLTDRVAARSSLSSKGH